MKKVLFLIHDLGPGGAEKVLINLVNNMDKTKFDITVMSMFAGGVNEQFLGEDIRYITLFKKAFRGNSKIMKLFSPEKLHKLFIKEKYDIEVAYLEGPSARVISGCPDSDTKLVGWIHTDLHSAKKLAKSFRSYNESVKCYKKFNRIICVSEEVKRAFCKHIGINPLVQVLYNTNESEKIIELSRHIDNSVFFSQKEIKIVGVGKLFKNKGFDRILRIAKQLLDENYPIHIYILGTGPEEANLKKFIIENGMENKVDLLGYQTNPYQFVSKCNLFVCSSFREGFSTAATEALIVGTPVCTVEVFGMKEMLGENNEFGVVVKNDEEELYYAIKDFLDNPDKLVFYKKQAEIRGRDFSTENTVKAVEEMLFNL